MPQFGGGTVGQRRKSGVVAKYLRINRGCSGTSHGRSPGGRGCFAFEQICGAATSGPWKSADDWILVPLAETSSENLYEVRIVVHKLKFIFIRLQAVAVAVNVFYSRRELL